MKLVFRIMTLTLVSVGLFGGGARADWPMQRQNVSRTAEASAASDLGTPAIQWRRYLGGAVDPLALLSADVDGDGSVEVLYVSGGRVVAKRANDRLLWETRPLTLRYIHGVRDLDGDGIADVIASGTPGRVAIFRGSDGQLEWLTAPGRFGPTIGAVRFADLDGDGGEDLYVADAACGSGGNLGDTAYAFDFSGGFGTGIDDGSEVLWQLERGRPYNCGVNDVILDVDGDGDLELIAWATTEMWLFDAATGLKVPSGDAALQQGYPTGFSIPYGTGRTWITDIEGDGNQDVVLYTNGSYAPTVNSRAVFVVSWDETRAPAERLHVRWVEQVPDLVADSHHYVSESAADLDGDGVVEVTSTFRVGGTDTTYVRDGRDGTVRVSAPGRIAAIVETEAGTNPVLVLEVGGQLLGYRFADLDALPAPAFSIPAATVLDGAREGLRARQSLGSLPITIPLGDGSRGLLVDEGGTLQLWNVSASPASVVGSYELPEEVAVVATNIQTDVGATGPGALLARSDGYLVVLDDSLMAVNFGGLEFSLPGIRTGGYYSGPDGAGAVPIAADFGDGRADVLVRDSRGGLLRLSLSEATITIPPAEVFRRSGTEMPLVVDLDGSAPPEVVARSSRQIVATSADGRTELWRTTIGGPTEVLHGDVIPLDTPAGLRLVSGIVDQGNGDGSLIALDASGAEVWQSTPTRVTGSGFGLPTVDELTGDATPDLMVNMASLLRHVDGADGALLGSLRSGHSQMTIDVRGRADPVTTIFSGSVVAPAGMTVDRPFTARTDVWTLGTYDARNNYGAVVDCGDGLRYATSADQSAQVTFVRAADGSERHDLFLVEGRAFTSELDAIRAGLYAGVVGNATSTTDLGGGTPAVLFGSTDGHLYAIDPCGATPELLWALSFRAPVGEAIFADTDGDGEDELVVSVADGFLYGVDTEALPAPEYVYDTDPRLFRTDADVDETRGVVLGARWAAVAGATAYEYAVFSAGGTPVSRNPSDESNPFIETTDTFAEHGERLEVGGVYFFAVRAIGPEGTSSEALSDGTVYLREVLGDDMGPMPPTDGGAATPDGGRPSVDAGADTDGGGGGCGCRVSGGGAPRWPWLALLPALLLWRRRR